MRIHPLLKRLANPKDRFGGWVAPHLALLLIAVAVYAVLVTVVLVSHYGRSYFEHRYRAPLAVPTARATTHRTYGVFPASASLDMPLWPGILDQGTLGSCAAHASSEALDYLYRLTHPTHRGIRFSPRFLYDYYSLTYAHGQDGGSWPDQDLEVVRNYGVPQLRQFAYPPYVIDPALPGGSIAANAVRFRIPTLAVTDILYGTNPGQSAVDAIKSQIAGGRPALLSIQVTPAFDNATATGGSVDQGPGAPSRGGHEIVAVAFDDATQTVTIANSWGRQWGVGGFAHLSYRFIELYNFGVQSVSLG